MRGNRANLRDYRRVEKVTFDGQVFDSKKERDRYVGLTVLESSGLISNLQRQVKYELIPPFELNGKKHRAMSYVADFQYVENGQVVTEDAKGFRTDVFKIKAKLMAFLKQIEVREV